jgi:anti-sigma B factor antagonist
MAAIHGIAVERVGDVTVVALSGEHDVSTAPYLREQVVPTLDAGNPLVVDLTAATFIDSSVLGVLLGGLRRAREHGLGYAIVLGDEAGSAVRRIFDVTGLVPVFPIHSRLEDAVADAAAEHAPA